MCTPPVNSAVLIWSGAEQGSSHTTVSNKMLVRSRHICCRHVMAVVSVLLLLLPWLRVFRKRTHYRLILPLSSTAYTIAPLLPGQSYLGPKNARESTICTCNTVLYSLISACDACQGASWITYCFIFIFSPNFPSLIVWVCR
jgi:hypothetical protein